LNESYTIKEIDHGAYTDLSFIHGPFHSLGVNANCLIGSSLSLRYLEKLDEMHKTPFNNHADINDKIIK
jgi:hypothetical protein